ncbi:hypothetical protein [Streptomyces sp. NRRL B-24484]|uniref:hypothetical protein n=1 Tax=Streptomyces sp. NRRL B-24484 TaxID=1463833 RepID=UPI0004BF4B4E|nr:hypothetical protein [Streptomyces sp. NRRL B-24484]
MNTHDVMLAGALKNIGDSWSVTALDWVSKFLMVALVLVCLVQVIRKMSIKAGLGAVIGLVLCWAVFSGRYSLSNIVETEFKDPGASQSSVQGMGAVRELPPVFQGRL